MNGIDMQENGLLSFGLSCTWPATEPVSRTAWPIYGSGKSCH